LFLLQILFADSVFIADSKRAIKVALYKRKSAEQSCLESFFNFGQKVSFLNMTKLMSDRTKNGLISPKTAKIGHFSHNFFTFKNFTFYPNFFKPPRRVFFSLFTFNSVTFYTRSKNQFYFSIYFTHPKTFWSNMGIFWGEIAHKSLITCLMIK